MRVFSILEGEYCFILELQDSFPRLSLKIREQNEWRENKQAKWSFLHSVYGIKIVNNFSINFKWINIIKVMLCVSCTACQCMCGIETRSELILYPTNNTKKLIKPKKAKNLNKLLNTYCFNNNSSKLVDMT